MTQTAYDSQEQFVRADDGTVKFGGTRVEGVPDRSVTTARPKPEYICVHKYLGGPVVRTGLVSDGRIVELIVPEDGMEYLPTKVREALSSGTPDVRFKVTDNRRRAGIGTQEITIGSVSVKYRSVELSGVDGRLVEVGVPRSIRTRRIPKVLQDAMVRPIPVPEKLTEFVQKNLVPSLSFQDLISKKEEEMLTLKVGSDGTPSDLQQIVSLAFNTGMTVVAELPDGTTAMATPTQATEVVAEPEPTTPVTTEEVTGEVVPTVDEPHPVFEKADLTDTVGAVVFTETPVEPEVSVV